MGNGIEKLTIQLNWELICKLSEIENKKESLQGKGIYFFVFQKLPYYVGITSNFEKRIKNHKNLFHKGGRTLKTPKLENAGTQEVIIFTLDWVPGKESISGYFDEGKVIKFDSKIDIVNNWIENIDIYLAKLELSNIELKIPESIIQYSLCQKYDINDEEGNTIGHLGKQELKLDGELLKYKLIIRGDPLIKNIFNGCGDSIVLEA